MIGNVTTAESIAGLTEVIKIGLLLAIPAFFIILTWTQKSFIAGICAIISVIGASTTLIDYFGTWIGAVIIISILGIAMTMLLEARGRGLQP